MNRVAFVRLWTRSLAKNKTFVKNFVHFYFAFFSFFPKNSCSRPFFPFFWAPRHLLTKILSPAPQTTFLLGQSQKNGSSF